MAKKIGQYAVHILDEKGAPHSFEAGQEVPDWVEKRLGAHCFEGGEHLFNEEGRNPASFGPNAVETKHVGGVPPRAGSGSGRDEWAAYAKSKNVSIEDDWKRDQIVDAVDKAGVPVE